MAIKFVILLCFLVTPAKQFFANDDGKEEFHFACPPGHHLSRFTILHLKTGFGWKFECRPHFVREGADVCQKVSINDPQNNEKTVECPGNDVVAGYSYKDYIFYMLCCKTNARPQAESCRDKEFMNLNEVFLSSVKYSFDFTIPEGSAIRGFPKTRYKDIGGNSVAIDDITICDYSKCIAESMKIRHPVTLTPGPIKVVGIATSQGCRQASYSTSLEQDATKTQSTSFEHSTDLSFSIGASLGYDVGFSLFGAKFGVSGSASVTGSHSFSNTESKGTSVSVSSGSSQTLEYTGPGAAIIIAHTREYHAKKQSAVADYSVVCENGEKYNESHKVSLAATQYGHTNYMTRHYHYDPKDCTPATAQCLEQIKGGDAVDIDKVVADFKKCVKILTNDSENK